MIIYRVMVKTSAKGGTFMDGTASMKLALQEAIHIQSEHQAYAVTIEAEDWKTLTKPKYYWFRLTRTDEGFGTEFKKRTGHSSQNLGKVWPAQPVTQADLPAASRLP